MNELEAILRSVRKDETPPTAEREHMKETERNLVSKLQIQLEKDGLHSEIRLEGSYPRDTWLRTDKDLDVFMMVPVTYAKEDLEAIWLDAAKKAMKDHSYTLRYAEHPYLELVVNGTRVNIVPCFKTEPGQWKSATDRTPYHTLYVLNKLKTDEQKSEVRVLKRFLLGTNTYRADIKVGGFSGYLAELLIIQYGSFHSMLQAASQWRLSEFIDIEGLYRGRMEELNILFKDPLIVVDPVDRRRNVASAVTQLSYDKFRVASRMFLENPNIQFFYPPQQPPPSMLKLKTMLQRRGTDILFIRVKGLKEVPDVLWGQLYKTVRALTNVLKEADFNVLRSWVWSDEHDLAFLVFELESNMIGSVKKRIGPMALSDGEKDFLRKYLGSKNTLSGPWIENGRWMVLIRRRQTNAQVLLQEKLKNDSGGIGVASRIAAAMKEGCRVLLNLQVFATVKGRRDFREALYSFLRDTPPWLQTFVKVQETP